MKAIQILCLICCFLLYNCEYHIKQEVDSVKEDINKTTGQYITILGVAQDAGFPQINCNKDCCNTFYKGEETKQLVSCLGLVDMVSKQKWLFDATPDITVQTQLLKDHHLDNGKVVDGVFLTHAHIGHYTGLMQFGREALGAKNIPVYAMPKMKRYLETNGPWSQLVNLNNIELKSLENKVSLKLNNYIQVTPFLVPHRDEYSETVGYKIEGNRKSTLFIPDIDKWHKWNQSIVEEVKKVDYAFLDASFFSNGELKRDMSLIPHPFITETTTLFKNEALETKQKIYFIHFNHTNPAIKNQHRLKDSIKKLGFNFAKQGDNFKL
ncbi:MBL fold metallo-hydrolase [uncultured Winogradskyella sp.]|uniref:MBL fold metallo-hydrolase n=1 Tax=uncultured Winogradskyella sp. TaxID=395353 RepID=UPI00262DDF1D|nr:MBL fold metallo-hydrolase [uncultured Winogradskyella sp.]